MAKTGLEGEIGGDGLKAPANHFFSAESISDPARRTAELEGIVSEQRVALEQLQQELADARHCMESALSYSNKMAEEAGNAARAKSRFLRNVSHELRTPLNSIIGMTRLLIETDLTDEQLEFSEIVHESAKELTRIIDDILDLSKIESNRLVLANEPFDLGELLEDTLEYTSFSAREKSIYVDLLCDPAVPTKLKGDTGRVRQVLVNLIGNAVKFTEKGRVDVRITMDSETDDTAVLRFVIQDTGIGIPEDADRMIFESFAVGDPSITRRHGGTGLGLAISKEVVKAMNGEIGGQNRKEGGAEFFFVAPFKKQSDAHAAWDEFRSLSGKRAVVFGTEQRSNEMLVDMLGAVGTAAVHADDSQALFLVSQNASKSGEIFDLALIDMEASMEINVLFPDGIQNHPAFRNTHFIGIHPPGHRPSGIPVKRRLFTLCMERPLRQFSLYRIMKSAFEGALPDARPSRPSRQVEPSVPLRVLLVEDHLYSQRLTCQILQRLGCKVATANNGLEAVETLRTELYDLVLMDIQMPFMDGLSAARSIRNPDSGTKDPDVPIIALTAHAYEEDKQLCLKAGMNDYLLKPIDPAALKSMIDKFVSCEESQI